MPELPEVQTIVSDLDQKIKGFEIAGFWTDWKKSIKMPMANFKKEIIGRKIEKIGRKGKNIIFHLSGGRVMLIHLKMTGHLLVKIPIEKILEAKNFGEKIKYQRDKFFDEKVNQYIRHKWPLKKGKKNLVLEFSDLRKFGKIRLIEKKNLENDKELSKIGVDPLSKEFTLKNLKEIFSAKSKMGVRNILMEQSLISGIGNIYVSEIMFEAGVAPQRKAGSLDEKEILDIHKNIIEILKKAVKMRGTSDSDYRDTAGKAGSFQKLLKVYNREKEKCQNCQSEIKRIKINQRSAYYCENCQK